MRPSTIRDVALEAGVSPATVSRFLNKSIQLPKETADRIDAAVAHLNYRPNALAKRLSLGSSEVIGLVTPDIANPFFAGLAAAAEEEAARLGYSMLLSSTLGARDREIATVEQLGSRHVDGLIIMTNRPDDGSLARYLTGRRDVVLLDEDVPGADVPKVFVENRAGAYAATRHLICSGHRVIGHIGGPSDLFSEQERYAGFAAAMAEAGLPVAGNHVLLQSYDQSWGHRAIRKLMRGRAPPTAVFTSSDYIAIGVLKGLREMGLGVPDDLSIASFDDMPFADLLHPPLTTVRQPADEMGRLGVRALVDLIKGKTVPVQQRLPTILIERQSVAPPRKMPKPVRSKSGQPEEKG
jgi:LacI family transcriptional regulator